MKLLQGAGGGSGSQTRTEDNLLSDDFVEVLLGVSEGPIKGLVGTTSVERGQSIFVGQTPFVNADGNPNFSNTAADGTPSTDPGFVWTNHLGTEADAPVEFTLGGGSTNQSVAVSLATNTPVIRQTLATVRGLMTLIQLRLKVTQLYLANDEGTFENTISFKVEYKASTSSTWLQWDPTGPVTTTITGKTTGGYVKELSIVVPALASDDYDIRVTKTSPISTSQNVTEMTWESFQMIAPGSRSFPNTALLHFKARATNQFSSIPEFSGIYDGWVMSVPANYNPELHTYDETLPWDGSFKQECTSNPAWVLYNLIINTRLGLARYYKNVAANRYAFYKVAKWCDEIVADGGVGLQPRFTFNEVVVQQRVGLEFLQYIAGSFSSSIFDDENGTVHLRTDVYETPLQIFCPENVSVEGFQYAYSDISSRTNSVTVSFTNPDLDWSEDRRIYEDPTLYHGSTLIDTNGRIPSDFIAVGCTNYHEAYRRAAYRLRAANTEVTSVSFSTARLGMLTAVFDTIYVADPTSGWSTPGRIKSVVDNVVNLRDAIYFETLNAVTMAIQTAGAITEITVVPPALGLQSYFTKTVGDFPGGDLSTAVFTIQGGTFGLLKPFRVMAIEELEEGGKAYRITALEINVNKYTDVESGIVSEPTQYSYRTPDFPLSPIGLTAVSGASEIRASPVTGALQFFIFLSWQVPALSYTSAYDVEWKEQATGVWIKEAPFMGNSILIGPVREEVYYDLRVTAVSPNGTRSRPTYVNNHFVPKHLVGPPNYHYFDVTFGATGRRYVTFGYETAAPPGVVGARIRFLEGSYGPGTWPAWNSMYPLHDGLMTGSFESDGGVPGDYAVAIVAVDISGNQSYGPIYLQRTLEVVHPPLYDNFDLVFDAAGRRYFTFGFTGAAPTSVWGAHLRFAVGFGTPVWETMTPLHDGVMTGSFDSAGGASGEFTVAIKSVNFAGTESSSFLSLQRTVPEAQGASTTIANYDNFEVSFDVSGRRFISFSYDGPPPIDLAGARIRFAVGFVTNPDWATMEPLYDGLMTGSFDSAGGAPGDYTVAIKAVSLTGIECATPRYLQRALPTVGQSGIVISPTAPSVTYPQQLWLDTSGT